MRAKQAAKIADELNEEENSIEIKKIAWLLDDISKEAKKIKYSMELDYHLNENQIRALETLGYRVVIFRLLGGTSIYWGDK